MFTRLEVRRIAFVLALLGLASCNANRSRNETVVYPGQPEKLAALQPADIAVAPVRDQAGGKVPVDELRAGFATALVERLYSPLDNEYVDGNWVESSFKGTPAPDGLLVVAITSWDSSHLYSNGDVTGEAEVLLFEGGDMSGGALWSNTVKATVNLGDGRGNPPTPAAHLTAEAGKLFARKALADLPERDPIAAHP